MNKPLSRMAVTLRLLAIAWPIGWALYVTLGDKGLTFSMADTMTALGALLIPAMVAYAVSWALEGYVSPDEDGRRSASHQ